MYITTPKRKSGATVVRLVQGYREKGKLKIKILKTLGQSKDKEEIERLKNLAHALKLKWETESKKPLAITEQIDLFDIDGESTLNDGLQDIFGGIYDKLGFDEVIEGTRKDAHWNQVLKNCVLSRFLEPSSKLRAVKLITDKLHMEVSHDQILNMMDLLFKKEEQIKEKVSKSIQKEAWFYDILLFDVTTLYFESVRVTDLKNFGYSKDGKFKEVQVILALLTDSQGLPINYELFPGNTAETKTFIPCFSKAREKYGLKRIRVTADKAMFSNKNLSHLEKMADLDYIISCPLRRLPVSLKKQILDKQNYVRLDEDKSYFQCSYENRQLTVLFSKKRASHEKKRREKLLEMIEKAEDTKGRIDTKKLVKNRGMAKYLEKIKGFTQLKKQAVKEDQMWDGIDGFCTNSKTISPKETLSSYRKLWKIEESFRVHKHLLKIRPIFHRLSKRIHAHVLICFLSYTVLRYTEICLKKKGLSCGTSELIHILCDVEQWILKDRRTRNKYLISKKLSKQAEQIYEAFSMKRKKGGYRLIDK